MCDTWDGGSGANACIIVEPEEIIPGETLHPDEKIPEDHAVEIVGWIERDDHLSETQTSAFFDDQAFLQLPEATREAATMISRVGSVPSWIQSASEGPSLGEGWRFVAQFDGLYSFFGAPKPLPGWITEDSERWEGRTHIAQGPNFGDGGLAYIFVRLIEGKAEGWMLWQCG